MLALHKLVHKLAALSYCMTWSHTDQKLKFLFPNGVSNKIYLPEGVSVNFDMWHNLLQSEQTC